MKKIDISQIVSPTSKQPFTANSLKFKQDYDSENYSALVKALITQNIGSYSLTTPYVISGCVLSGTYNITAGEIFYGGNFYNVTAKTSSVNPIRLILTKTYDATADPLTFTDGVTKNVHEIYTYVSTDVSTGGILASSLVSVYGSGKITVDTTPTNQSTNITTGTDLNLATYTTPNDGITRKFLINFCCSVDFAPSGSTTIGGQASIYSTESGGTILRSGEVKLEEQAAIDIVGVTFPMSLSKIASIPPNTTIKIQIQAATPSGGNINFSRNGFSMLEI